MKNFVIATVSAVALLGANAYAQEHSPKVEKVRPTPIVAGKAAPHHPAHAHHKHHAHHGHHQGHPLAVYVNYPPVNVAAFGACPCEYYQDNKDYGYVWHEGYFWYPQAHANLLVGYAPHHMRDSYWYPSRLHPHAVYVERQHMTHPHLYPVVGEGHPAAMKHMHKHRHHAGKVHHKAKVHHSSHVNQPTAAPMHKMGAEIEAPHSAMKAE